MSVSGIILAAVVVGGTGLVISVLLGIASEKFKVPIDEKEVLEHYCSESMSEWYYSDLLSFFKINPNKKYTRFRDLSNDIQHDKDEAFKSYPY